VIRFKLGATDVWQKCLSVLKMRHEKEQSKPAALLQIWLFNWRVREILRTHYPYSRSIKICNI